jgi:HK97 family phage prohead protease
LTTSSSTANSRYAAYTAGVPNVLASEPSAADRARLEQKRGLTSVTRGYAIPDLEVRAPAEGTHIATFGGHAAATGRSYDMFGGPDAGGWSETVVRGAFGPTLGRNPDVSFLVNHEGMSLARTTAGNLWLSEDKVGLAVKAELDTRDTNANNLVIGMQNGNINEMSFAFRVTKQEWLNTDGEVVPWWDMTGVNRQIQVVDLEKGDVSAVNYGANPYTDAALRSLADIRGLSLDDCEPDELREAISYLQSRLPAPAVHPELVAEQHRLLADYARLRGEVL